MPLPWPEQYLAMLEDIKNAWGVQGDIQLLSEYGEGKSTARVFLVDLNSSRHQGKAILKLDQPSRWDGELSERERHALAVHASQSFAESHLPSVIDTFDLNGQTAFLISVAGDLLRTTELYRLDFQRQADVLPRLARDLLEEWNQSYAVSQAVPPYAILRDWLGYRLDPNEGHICSFVENGCGIPVTSTAFSVRGRWLPNPYSFGVTDSLWKGSRELVGVIGHIHGDLHGHNVLIRLDGPHNHTYFVIDFGLYRDKSYLFYDHAYLELSHLLKHKGAIPHERWLEINDALNGVGNASELDDQGIVSVLKVARTELTTWATRHEKNREEYLVGQAILARVAAGLNYVNKEKVSAHQRKLSFLYAATNLERYLQLFGVEWDRTGPAVTLESQLIAVPQTDQWRDVWNACEGLDVHRSVYILIADSKLRELDAHSLRVLGRVPWAAVVDFDGGPDDGSVLSTLRPEILTHRAFRQTDPQSIHNLNFDNATNWFCVVNGEGGPDPTVNLHTWRRSYLPLIRTLAQKLRAFVSPRPLHCVYLVPSLPGEVVKGVWQNLDEVFQDHSKHVFLHGGNVSVEALENAPNIHLSDCPVPEFLAGLWRMYGSPGADAPVTIPTREGAKTLSDEDYRYLSEDLEVVHAGLSANPELSDRVGLDFWRGHEITWTELDMYADVQRPECVKLRDLIKDKMEGPRVSEISLQHSAGAGGTTVAKRVAWDLKDTYPTVFVQHFSENTVSRIERLFHESTLPVLVVMEEARVPVPSQTKLRNALLGRNVRACLVSVSRRVTPRGDIRLVDPMEVREARRFAGAYRSIAMADRHDVLNRLAEDDDLQPYRSPFFFGLFSFEKEFVHVPDFVRFHLEGLSATAAKAIKYLALVTRFSQSHLTEEEIKRLFDLSSERPLRLEELFGEASARLVLFRNQEARLLHPLIAEEVLRQLLGGPDSPGDIWKGQLTDLSCQFVDELTSICGEDSSSLRDLLLQLFIARDFWENEGRKQFSELLLTIPNEAGQHRVLERLVARHPGEAHFWNHLGRHHMYVMKSSYEHAETCLIQAMELDPYNDIHPHALGMVYRYAIQNRFKDFGRQRVSADTAAREVQRLAEQASNAFTKARELDQETEYGYITNIQLISEIISNLYRLSGCSSYAQFLGTIGSASLWVRQQLPQAEELLRKVKALQSEENLSYHTRLCDAQIKGFYDQYETMISSLQRLLARDGTQRLAVHRVIAHAMYSHQGHAWHTMRSTELQAIEEMMSENLDQDPTNSHDLWMWFQAYRRLETFNVLEAIDRLNRWAIREATAEAHYYLYILHFHRYRQGIIDDHTLVQQHIERCKAVAYQVRRTRCFEWLAKEPVWCPLVHQSELGEWKSGFYERSGLLAEVRGTVLEVKGPQTGTLSMGPLQVFFVPGPDILAERDEGKPARFLLGFSYDGLRAWKVQLER